LFETVRPRGRGQYSNPEVADAITESGVKISAAYLWLLRTGRRDNPTLRHIEALAKFFGVPPGYFFDDDQAAAVDKQLELLVAARDADVREIMLRSTDLSKPNRDAVLQIIKNIERTQGTVDGPTQSADVVGGGAGGRGRSTDSEEAGPERPDHSSG
jgi:transcriptional regulator with XRE-family HTH domain